MDRNGLNLQESCQNVRNHIKDIERCIADNSPQGFTDDEDQALVITNLLQAKSMALYALAKSEENILSDELFRMQVQNAQ